MDIGRRCKMKKFDKVFKHYDSFINLFNLNQEKQIKDILDLQGNEIILDIGGGTGRLAEHISKDCQKVYVLDESKGMLSKVKENKKVQAILANALKTPFEDASVDVVILSDVFHHIKNQTKLIKEANRVLKKNGKLIILDFEKNHIRIKFLRAFEHLLFGKLYFKTSQEIKEIVQQSFTITQLIHKQYYFIIKGEKNV